MVLRHKARKTELPTRLSHYTTLPGLYGIIETGQIWASNVSFLNDRRELEHGLEASLKVIKTFTTTAQHRPWHAALKQAAKSLEEGRIPSTYAACFCERKDVLSQWRGYGGREQGVSLTFERVRLSREMRASNAHLFPVIYGNISTEDRMTEALAAELQSLDDFEFAVSGDTTEARELAAHAAICRLLPQFKHWGFRDERELRYVVQRDTLTDDVCFRATGDVMTPFIRLMPRSEEKLPLVSVTVGPGRDTELTRRSLRLFLDQHGYGRTTVGVSQVPFRT